MGGCCEYGVCDICGKSAPLDRKYYFYDIKCSCCNSADSPHFEIVRFCKNCTPVPPRRLSVVFEPYTNEQMTMYTRGVKLKRIMKKLNKIKKPT